MDIAHREFTSAAEMRAHAVAVHQRCFNPPVRIAKAIEAPVEPEIIVPPVITPQWSAESLHFDAHVIEWRNRMANQSKAFLKDRCVELGIPFAVIVGKDRRREVTDLRHQLVWEVQNKFGMSFPALGRLFGGRDHTTMLYSVRKVEAMRGAA